MLPKARTPIMGTASAAALNRPDESHRNFRSRTKNVSANGSMRFAGVACSACVATDRGKAPLEASRWRTGYRGRISRVARTELQERGKPEHCPRHDPREEGGGPGGLNVGP